MNEGNNVLVLSWFIDIGANCYDLPVRLAKCLIFDGLTGREDIHCGFVRFEQGVFEYDPVAPIIYVYFSSVDT